MHRRIPSVSAVLLLVPVALAADTVAPAVTGRGPWLWVATVLLGVLEGGILARLYALKPLRCAGWMIPANLLTSWIGFWFLPTLLRIDLLHDPGAVAANLVLPYAVTLVVEWPFVALCVRGAPGWLGRSVRGSLVAQTAGYVVLIAVALLIGGGPRRSGESEMAALAAMRADLRLLVTAQNDYFVEHVTYARSVADLRGLKTPFVPSPRDVIVIVEASDSGWAATVHREVPADSVRTGIAASEQTCAIYVGRAKPPIAGQPEGEPQCR